MKRQLERELKVRVADGFELPELDGERLEPRVFVSAYHDTSDLRLARARVTLRHRVEHGRGRWQLKLPAGAARLELEVDGGPVAAPEELTRLLPALTRRGELVEVARLRTRREGILVRDGRRRLAELVLDAVSVVDGQRVTKTWEELEIEAVEADDGELHEIGKALRKAGAGGREKRPKLFQALDLPVPAGPSNGQPRSLPDALQRMFAVQLDRMLAHDPGTRLGTDPEDLHQLRVATRRLRAFLRAARPLVDAGWANSLRDELSWLGGALGPVRDADVLLAHLHEESALLEPDERDAFDELLSAVEVERDEARGPMLEALDSDRYLVLLDRLEEAAATGPPLVAGGRSAAALVRADVLRLRKSADALGDEPTDEALHDTRIRAKRARYVSELAEPFVGKQSRRLARGAERIQDALGAHQDAVVAEQRIRSLLQQSSGPAAHFAAGRLVERQRARRVAARTSYAEAWERFDRLRLPASKS